MNMRNATCVGTQTSKVPTRMTLLFIPYTAVVLWQCVVRARDKQISPRVRLSRARTSEMNITGTLPQAGNVKLFVPSLSTQDSTRPKQNIVNVVLMRSDKTG